MNFKNFDFFSPYIVAIAIMVFLSMGYIGSFNYRFEYPLSAETIGTVLLATLVFLIGAGIIKSQVTIYENESSPIYIKINNFFNQKILITLVLIDYTSINKYDSYWRNSTFQQRTEIKCNYKHLENSLSIIFNYDKSFNSQIL